MNRIALIALFTASNVGAQTPSVAFQAPAQPTPPTLATIAPAAPTSTLRAGAEVLLRTVEPLTTEHKSLKEGQRIHLEVAENVMLGNRIVIPAGSPADAEVTDVQNKGMWGKSGHFTARALYTRVGDRQIRLSGVFNEHGSTGTAGVVAAIAFVPIAGFLVTGTSARMPAGTPVKAFLDEDLTLLN
ncbi:MAG TPA: hypothetical protein VGU01_11210 [Sphingomicrobium sp.]|nr:hypothetical protein [Sphingomicrobium sp.]